MTGDKPTFWARLGALLREFPWTRRVLTFLKEFGAAGALGLLVGILLAVAFARYWIPLVPPRVTGDTARPNTDSLEHELIASMFGIASVGAAERFQLFSGKEEADKKVAELFRLAKDSICIVTVHGATWIAQPGMKEDFQAALRAAKVRLCLVDPKGGAFEALTTSRLRGFEHEAGKELLRPSVLREANDTYRQMLADSALGKNLTIYHYSAYPFIRFSVYDGMKATFVFVPFLNTGTKANMYYSEDPWIVECLLRIFDNFRNASRIVTSDSLYEALWN